MWAVTCSGRRKPPITAQTRDRVGQTNNDLLCQIVLSLARYMVGHGPVTKLITGVARARAVISACKSARERFLRDHKCGFAEMNVDASVSTAD